MTTEMNDNKPEKINKLLEFIKNNLSNNTNFLDSIVAITDFISNPIWICDQNKNVLYANVAFYQIFSLDINNENYIWNFGFGDYINKSVTNQPKQINILDKNYLFNTFTSITTLKEKTITIFLIEANNISEQELYNKELFFDTLWDFTTNCLRLVDEDGIIINVNNAFCDLVKKRKDELIGKYYDSFYLNPEPPSVNFLKYYKPDIETFVTLWNGEELYLNVKSKTVTLQNGKKAVLSIIRDITHLRKTEYQLKRLEQKFNETADLIPLTLFETDIDGNIIFCNNFAYKLFNATESIYERKYNIADFIAPEDLPKLHNNFIINITNKKTVTFEYTAIKLTGEKFPILVYSTPIFDNNKPIGLRGIILDITEQKQLQENIRKSELLYKSIVETSPDGISLMDLNGNIIFANDRKAKLFGFDNGNQLLNLNAFTFICDEYLPLVNKVYFKLLKTLRLDPITIKLKRKDGTTFFGEFRAKIITDNEGKPLYIMDVVTDITEKIKIEEERKLNEIRTETLLKVYQMQNQNIDKISDFIFTETVKQTESEGGYLIELKDENEIDKFYLNINNQTKVIKNINLSTYLNDSELPIWLYPLKTKKEVVFNDFSYIYANQISLPETDILIKRILAIPIFTNEKVHIITGLFNKKHPYTEQETKQFSLMMNSLHIAVQNILNVHNLKIFKQAIEQNPTIIIITGYNRVINYVNKKFTEVTGYAFNDVVNKTTAEIGLFPYKQNTEQAKQAEELLRNNKPWQGEIEFTKADGEVCWLSLNISPITNKNGEIINFLGIAQDITEIKNYESQLIEAKELAEKSDRLKSEFLAQMSHEIRTPINVILSFMSLIRDELSEHLDEDLKTSFASINRAGTRLIRTIDLLLNMSEIQTGTYDYKPIELDIDKDILQPLITEQIYLAKSKNLSLTYDNKSTNSIIYGDNYSVYQIFSNLIDNAIKFTKNGGVNVSIYNNNNEIVCKIKDTGIGISEEYLPILFTPFSQEQQGYTRSFEGNGLGLALVKKYCELNNAQIYCESKKGVGSTFTVIFKNS